MTFVKCHMKPMCACNDQAHSLVSGGLGGVDGRAESSDLRIGGHRRQSVEKILIDVLENSLEHRLTFRRFETPAEICDTRYII